MDEAQQRKEKGSGQETANKESEKKVEESGVTEGVESGKKEEVCTDVKENQNKEKGTDPNNLLNVTPTQDTATKEPLEGGATTTAVGGNSKDNQQKEEECVQVAELIKMDESNSSIAVDALDIAKLSSMLEEGADTGGLGSVSDNDSSSECHVIVT